MIEVILPQDNGTPGRIGKTCTNVVAAIVAGTTGRDESRSHTFIAKEIPRGKNTTQRIATVKRANVGGEIGARGAQLLTLACHPNG